MLIPKNFISILFLLIAVPGVMLKMSSQVENIVQAYKTLAKIPTVVGGRLNKAGNSITSKWSVRNLDKGKMTKYLFNYNIDNELNVISKSDFGVDATNELLSSVSPNEKYRAVIREEKDSKDVKKQYLEVWQANRLAHCIELNALEVHGDVYADSEFGSLEWSPDETRVVYVAEKKLPKSEPYIKRKPQKDDTTAHEKGSGEPAVTKGEEYVYRQDWGEQLVGKHLSVIVVCSLHNEKLTVLEGLPAGWCPGQVRFAPDGNSVIGVAWTTEPRRLGLIFCTNRPSYIFNLDFNGKYKKISSDDFAVRSPRLNVAGDRLVWLQRTAHGPHHACQQLVSTSWPPAEKVEVKVLIDIIQSHVVTENNRWFYGVYSQALPRNCFTSDDKRIVFSSPESTEICTYVLDIESGKLVDITYRRLPGSTVLLDMKNDTLLAYWTRISVPPQIIVGKLAETGADPQISWQPVSDIIDVPSLQSTIVRYVDVTPENKEDGPESFSMLNILPSGQGKDFPVVLWPHGGPHANFVNAYSLEAALFVTLGFSLCQVNYRGSTGKGQASIDFLLKRIGTADVEDCKSALDSFLGRYPVNRNSMFLFGGSHGGYLVTLLSAKYPDLFSAVVSRNPVTDVATMLGSTDIADWCAVEAGYNFTEKGSPSNEEMVAMRRCSPLSYVDKVTSPTALMLGSVDKRVPYYQGLDYYRRLKANGCKTRLYMYEDNHSLSSLPSEMDNIINSISWFYEHMK